LPYGPLLFSNLAIAEWLVGRSDSALASALESIDLAQSLEDPFTLALGLAAAATVQMWRRDAAAALELARRGMQVSEDAGSGLGMMRAASIFQLASVGFELRAVMSLHVVAAGATRLKAAKDLRQLYGAFTEGSTTGDLVDAGRLLESIASNS
jgi:hypothetical protein